MALRLDKAVVKGELDNTERGRVRGRLWLLGREEPVTLDLEGDPWRDLAGLRITFVNPAPEPQELAPMLEPTQRGQVGDITAARKVKAFTVPEEVWQKALLEDRIKEIPTEWRNALYLEWFSVANGRCVIESSSFDITPAGEPAWQMTAEDEAAQQRANLDAMRDFLQRIIQRPPPRPELQEGAPDEDAFSEDSWEETLKASDRLMDADLEAMDKYGDDEENERLRGYVMGWDDTPPLPGATADFGTEDAGGGETPLWLGGEEDADSDDETGLDDDGGDFEDADVDDDDEAFNGLFDTESKHPLQETAHDLVLRLMSDLRESGLDSNGRRDDALDDFISNAMRISGKLAAALGGRRDMEDVMHRGYVLAITRRCLNWANEALRALENLLQQEEHTAHHPMFEAWRAEIFKIREGISDLRRELRQES